MSVIYSTQVSVDNLGCWADLRGHLEYLDSLEYVKCLHEKMGNLNIRIIKKEIVYEIGPKEKQ